MQPIGGHIYVIRDPLTDDHIVSVEMERGKEAFIVQQKRPLTAREVGALLRQIHQVYA